MRKGTTFILVVSAAFVVGFIAALRSEALPLGVRGEWEWLRVPYGPNLLDLMLAGVGVSGFALFVGLGMRSLLKAATTLKEGCWLLGLVFASVAVQGVAQTGAPVGYGLSKWVVALHHKGSSGYFTVARSEARDLWRFLADYPAWVRHQDALHIGTHPPGLIAAEAALLHALERSPGSARFVVDHAPESVALTLRLFGQDNPMTPADRATLVLTGAFTLLACGATVAPLYLLARATLPAPSAWAVAALWPLAPSAVLFQPAADTAFPVLSTTALAFAAWSSRVSNRQGRILAAAAGLTLGVGMQLTLAFLAVGLIAGLVIASSGRNVSERSLLLAAVGLGFLGLTLALWAAAFGNPFVTWWWNQRNHARFYAEYPRSFAAWSVMNPLELAVGLGLASSLWGLTSLRWPRGVPRVSVAAFAVLTVLTLSGRNLSEVGRLWLPFMPALLVASGFAVRRAGGGAWVLGLSVALAGAQTLALQSLIQVVYPV